MQTDEREPESVARSRRASTLVPAPVILNVMRLDGGISMKQRLWILWLASLIAIVAGLPITEASAQSEDEIERVEDARYTAMISLDLAALGQILADEFLYHRASGIVSTKSEFIDGIRQGKVRFHRAERYDVKIHFYGNVATAMGSTRLDYEKNGEPRRADLRYLNTWVKRDGRWQLVARQSAFKSK
jgi:ketosteroid isomerase-like protein